MNDFWSACLSRFERELPVQQFNAWIKSLRLEKVDNEPSHLRLVAPNRYVLDWIRKRYLNQIEVLALDYFPGPMIINLAVEERATETPMPEEEAAPVIVPVSKNLMASCDPAYEKNPP